jgi:hypothetical protein
MRLKAVSIFAGVMLAMAGHAQSIIAPDEWTVKTDDPRPTSKTINITRGEYRDLIPRVMNGSSAWSFPASTVVEMRYKSSDMTNTYYSKTGSVYSATNGQFKVTWTPSCEADARAYSFEIRASTGDVVQIKIKGNIILTDSLSTLGSITNPAVHVDIDWNTVNSLNATNAPWATGALVDSTARAGVASNVSGIAAINVLLTNSYLRVSNNLDGTWSLYGPGE